MPTRSPFGVGEWYHCYNRGVDKRRIFETISDYDRFLLSLYAGNSTTPIHVSNFSDRRLSSVLADDSIERDEPLVEIGAYCCMPNHFHLALKEIREGGIALFMQKVCTGYTMYFNKKNERTGALLAGTFKARHVKDDRYLKHLIAYIHLNPVELFETRWKDGKGNINKIKRELLRYRYSSLLDFVSNKDRLERHILGDSIFSLYETLPSLSETVADAKTYYEENWQG
ncbi:MAG: hypothetical protein Q7R54_01945 [bacterium]|nr:hypothetical protein [bacterium]